MFLLAMIGCVQFVVLTAVAMWLYPGGTYDDPTTEGYSFFGNYFSDLGLTETLLGESNRISSLLFATALALAGICLVLFFMVMPHHFTNRREARLLSVAGSAFGVLSGISYIGVALAPANLSIDTHMTFIYAASVSSFLTAILYAGAILLTEGYANAFAFVFMAFALIIGAFMGLWVAGPEDLAIRATGQKIVVYAQTMCMFLQAFGGWRRQKLSADAVV